MYRGVKLLERAKKKEKKAFDKRLRNVVTIDDMQFGSMPGMGTIDAGFILIRIQEEYLAKQKEVIHVPCRYEKRI